MVVVLFQEKIRSNRWELEKENHGTSDDAIFLLHYLNNAKNVFCVNEVAYFNYVHHNSFTRRIYDDNQKYVKGLVDLLNYLNGFKAVSTFAIELLAIQKGRVRKNAIYRSLLLHSKSNEYSTLMSLLFGVDDLQRLKVFYKTRLRYLAIKAAGVHGMRILLTRVVNWKG